MTAFAAAPRLEDEHATPLRILVVEDDADARELLQIAVRGLGYPCRSVADAEAACSAIAEGMVDVVLADCQLPGMSGMDLCRRIRASDARKYVYFLLVTGFSDHDHLVEAIHTGADDVQRKPVDLDELEARLVIAARRLA